MGVDGKPCRTHADWRGGRGLSLFDQLSDSSKDGISDAYSRAGTLLQESLLALGELSGNRCKCSGVLCGGALLCR